MTRICTRTRIRMPPPALRPGADENDNKHTPEAKAMPSKRSWRKLVKKLQRKRRRQKCAQERDKQQAKLEADPAHQNLLQQQNQLERIQRLDEERQQQDEEEAWLRREALAQRQFHLDRVKRQQEEAEMEQLREQEHQKLAEREAAQRKKHEERERLAAEAAAEFEAMMQRMQDYLDNTEQQTPPAELRRIVETQPSERLCEFFTRTNSCRYGHSCSFNHRRPMLARILLIRHFFTHALLQSKEEEHKEYASADAHLESTELDLRAAYDEFFADVLPELEKFGQIVNFRTLRNTLPHLRGHVFVEYEQERAALRAFIGLQGRFYAARRLNVEFSNLQIWRGAICGLSLARKCPKGFSCGYLHLMRNPQNLYNGNLEQTPRTVDSSRVLNTPNWQAESSVEHSRNWRWSESPELESRATMSKTSRSSKSKSPSKSSRNDRARSSKISRSSKTKSQITNRSSKSKSSSKSSRNDRSRSSKNSRSSKTKSPRNSPSYKSKSPSKSIRSDRSRLRSDRSRSNSSSSRSPRSKHWK